MQAKVGEEQVKFVEGARVGGWPGYDFRAAIGECVITFLTQYNVKTLLASVFRIKV